ncbi:MAG TPA: DUF4838 domain-containing protein [Candidatus Latescibacteria bacterium]|nr:DUF4838 domain-containing protein [Candidatus Latescibacterota bacterium]HJP33482.1 DUF4838 domain-containing protein [Candidatus Latescibacterota bacterium]
MCPPRWLLVGSFLFVVALSLVACMGPTVFTLTPERASRTQIVVPDSPSPTQTGAAELLAEHLGSLLGADLPIVGVDAPSLDGEILIGPSSRTRQLGVDIDVDSLGEDGFLLRTVAGRLVIIGGSEKGAVYGAATFLEEHLGFRFYAADAFVAPDVDRFEIPDGLDITWIPPIEFREDFYRGVWDPAYQEWHKLDRHVEEWGLWVHTFAGLVPPDEHFEAHPEWFAEVDGRRIPNGQLCLTNEAMFDVLVTNLRQRIEAEPDKKYWSVSQNDTYGFCTCDRCAAIDAEQEAHSGSLIDFTNRVAAQFPTRTISTLAYQYSRKAPKHLRPADNVLVVLAPIELNRSQPVASDPSAAAFRAELEDWARVTDRLLIWDYVIQFSNLVSPFPNLRVLQPNLQYFVDNSAVAHFQQGNREIGGEWAELRAYLIAKLLWNPKVNVEALIDDFLAGYYGAAAPHLRSYIDTQHEALAASGAGLGIFGNPIGASKSYLTPELMATYNAQFDDAEQAVAGAPTHLQRVHWARQPLHFAWLEQAKTRASGEDGLFERDAAGNWQPREEILTRLDDFVALAEQQGVTRVHEWHTTPVEYGQRYRQVLERVPVDHLAVGRPIRFTIPFSPKYPADGAATLVDGLHGPIDHSFAWLGWEGEDLEAVIDLGQDATVSRVRMDFLQSTGSWIWLPLQLEVDLSHDGTTWETVGLVKASADEHQGAVFTESFAVEFTPRSARHIRVRASSRQICPDWHIGAGGPSWIFTDEIVVE